MSTTNESIEELRNRYDMLSHKKTEAETNLRNAQKQLDKLQKEALKEYDTSDLDVLRKKLTEMNEENERQTAEYEKHLDEIEEKLSQIESDARMPTATLEESDIDPADYNPFAEE